MHAVGAALALWRACSLRHSRIASLREKAFALAELLEIGTVWVPTLRDAKATIFAKGPRPDFQLGLLEVLRNQSPLDDAPQFAPGAHALLEAQSGNFEKVEALLKQGGYIDRKGRKDRFAELLLASREMYEGGLTNATRARAFSYAPAQAAEMATLKTQVSLAEAALDKARHALGGNYNPFHIPEASFE